MNSSFPKGIYRELEYIGLNHTQIEILHFVTENSPVQSKDIILFTEMSKSTVLYSLNKLRSFQLIRKSRIGNKEFYEIQNQTVIQEVISRQADKEIHSVQERFASLKIFWKQLQYEHDHHIQVFSGIEKIHLLYKDIIAHAKDDITIIEFDHTVHCRHVKKDIIRNYLYHPKLPLRGQLFLYNQKIAFIENCDKAITSSIITSPLLVNIIRTIIKH